MSLANHATFHAIARQFVVATEGDIHADNFMPWLRQPEQHTLIHAFFAAIPPPSDEAAFASRFNEFVAVLAEEYNAWRNEGAEPGGERMNEQAQTPDSEVTGADTSAPVAEFERSQRQRLIAAGIERCPWCDGDGERHATASGPRVFCAPCDGSGEAERWHGAAADEWRRRRDDRDRLVRGPLIGARVVKA
jgi:hypothetical protein